MESAVMVHEEVCLGAMLPLQILTQMSQTQRKLSLGPLLRDSKPQSLRLGQLQVDLYAHTNLVTLVAADTD